MGLNKDILVFDPSDAANSDSVGSYVRAGSDGDLIASQTIAAEEWLNVASALFDGSGNAISSTGGALDVNIASGTLTIQFDEVNDDDVDAGGSIKIGGRAIDQSSALSALSAAGDRGDLLMDLYRRHFINDSASISVVTSAVSVATTATALPTTPAAGRRDVIIQNLSTQPVFVGSGSVTTANGLRIPRGGSVAMRAGEAVALSGIVTAGTAAVRVLELA